MLSIFHHNKRIIFPPFLYILLSWRVLLPLAVLGYDDSSLTHNFSQETDWL